MEWTPPRMHWPWWFSSREMMLPPEPPTWRIDYRDPIAEACFWTFLWLGVCAPLELLRRQQTFTDGKRTYTWREFCSKVVTGRVAGRIRS